MLTYEVKVYFARGYIGDPFWPVLDRIITIEKKSGMNRAKSDANRRKALEEYLQRENITYENYLEMKRQSTEPFYRNGSGAIIIPENHVASFLVATCDQIRAASRPCAPEQVRSRFVCSPWITGKQEPDGVWERFATVTSGTGQTLSNQRGLRRSAFISDFSTQGTIEFDTEFIEPKTLRQALEWGGKFVGIGASRKMGWGRFELRDFSALSGA
jgi:hypothetical protein